MTKFNLVPFAPNLIANSLSGDIFSVFNTQKKLLEISITFVLQGSMKNIVWPTNQYNHQPGRKHDLWLSTCFECFLSFHGQSNYFELNFSPSGDWQTYEFSRYRHERQDAINLILSNSVIEHKADQTCVSVELEYGDPNFVTNQLLKKHLHIGISVILKDLHGQFHYFALKHNSDTQADFHDPKTHILNINSGQ
ncbi:MAG: hypothetical protein ACI9CE_002987 [Flavobacterium sp.]|jgi:hypothetical protein